ncbi:MAG: methyltransferase [Deltaproteobacteria bacterium]|nr:methyltransferase [Deltaproteobacteria bacterium]
MTQHPTLIGDTTPYPKSYQLDDYNVTVVNHANVFSRQKLDIGTRFFLENMPSDSSAKDVIDLGCGNGLLGVVYALKNPRAQLTFVDESYMAVASARTNYEHALDMCDNGERGSAEFFVTDCLTDIETNSIDLILNNPPFHQNTAVGDHVAWQMFIESKKVLRNNGELWVIGNRHLGYHTKLKRLFGNCETVASNQKFVLLKARKRSSHH